jgi:transposase-like protein
LSTSISVGHLNNINNVRYLNKIQQKERYLVAVYSATKDGNEFLKDLGLRIVVRNTKEHKYTHTEVVPAMYEMELDVLMKPLGPFGTLVGIIGDYDSRVGVENLTENTKREGLPAISVQETNNFSHLYKKYSVGTMYLFTADDPPIGGNPLTDKHFFLHSPIYESGDKQDDQERVEVQQIYMLKMKVCPNSKCSLYGKTGNGNIVFNGTHWTKDRTSVRRFLCKECNKSFCSRAGSIFYGLRSPEEKVLTALKLLVKGMPLRGVAKLLGIKLDTIRHWLKEAAEQSEKIDAALMKELDVSQVELDTLWTFVKGNSLRQRAALWKARYGQVQTTPKKAVSSLGS